MNANGLPSSGLLERTRLVRQQLVEEPAVVLLRDAEEVGDAQQRVRIGVVGHELAATGRVEPVDEAVGEPPHERLAVLEPLRRHEPHQQRPVIAVLRWVERGDVLADRELRARYSSISSVTSSVPGSTGSLGNGPLAELHDRVALGVAPHRDRLVVARHRDDAVRRHVPYRALPQVLVVRHSGRRGSTRP